MYAASLPLPVLAIFPLNALNNMVAAAEAANAAGLASEDSSSSGVLLFASDLGNGIWVTSLRFDSLSLRTVTRVINRLFPHAVLKVKK